MRCAAAYPGLSSRAAATCASRLDETPTEVTLDLRQMLSDAQPLRARALDYERVAYDYAATCLERGGAYSSPLVDEGDWEANHFVRRADFLQMRSRLPR